MNLISLSLFQLRPEIGHPIPRPSQPHRTTDMGPPASSKSSQPHRAPDIDPPVPKSVPAHPTPSSSGNVNNTNSNDVIDGTRTRQSLGSASSVSGSSSISDQSAETLQTKRR